jgi:hypothetical protein
MQCSAHMISSSYLKYASICWYGLTQKLSFRVPLSRLLVVWELRELKNIQFLWQLGTEC